MQINNTTDGVIHIVDDSEAIRDSLAELLASVGMKTETYATSREFLDSCRSDQPGCVILDLRLPGMDGLELQRQLRERHIEMPIIFLSAHGDMGVAVLAMKRGAADFLSKPFREQDLLDSIKAALAQDAGNRARRLRHFDAGARLSKLTPRERDVLALLLEGNSNKMIASQLGLSHKTVEFHRSRIMAKSNAGGLADLVRMSMLAREMEPALV